MTKTMNKVRNLFKGALVIMLISIAPTLQANEIVNPAISKTPDAAEIQKLTDRLEEIKAMDIGNMSNKEKRALRKEVKAAEKKVQSSGVYISVGALIIIILLLIILL
jgi:hypothetical protein